MENLVENISKSVAIELLFEEMPTRPTANAIFREARKIFGDINIINRDENDIEFSVDKFVAYNEFICIRHIEETNINHTI